MKKNRTMRRSQLDQFYGQLKSLNLARPKLGWLKEVRESLGMSMQDLALRLETIKQRIERIEKDEISGKVTMETMQKAAEAMNCEFVYFIVPRTSLAKIVDAQAQIVAEEISKNVEQSMQLEKQGTSVASQKLRLQSIKTKILLEDFRNLWKKK